jgi:hypothetical protein
VGLVPFAAGCALVTWLVRWVTFETAPIGAYGANAFVIHFLPARLLAPALGMVAARHIGRLRRPVPLGAGVALALPATLLFVEALRVAVDGNTPGTTAGLLSPAVPLVAGLPALWLLASAVLRVPGVSTLLVWGGRHSLSLLVAQDFVRFGVGTLLARGYRPQDAFWLTLPVYLAVTLLATRVWHPLPERAWTRFEQLARWRRPPPPSADHPGRGVTSPQPEERIMRAG